jgi:hypothetical protein
VAWLQGSGRLRQYNARGWLEAGVRGLPQGFRGSAVIRSRPWLGTWILEKLCGMIQVRESS